MIIDEDVYHIGASLKDLGKKLFAFSKMDVMTGPNYSQSYNGLCLRQALQRGHDFGGFPTIHGKDISR